MRHTDEEIEMAAVEFEQWTDSIDVDSVEAEDVSELRDVAKAADAVRITDAQLTEAVAVARAHGHSWNRIADSLGVSRQAARQRYNELVDI